MLTKYPFAQVERLIDYYSRYGCINKLSEKIVKEIPDSFNTLCFDQNRFCPELPEEVAVTSKRASNKRICNAVNYLAYCYWYAGVTRDIPIDMIELSLDYNRTIDKRPWPDAVVSLISRLTRRVVNELRMRGADGAYYSHQGEPKGGEFTVKGTLLMVTTQREHPSLQQALMLLMNFFLRRSEHRQIKKIGLINPVTGYVYTLPVLGVSQDRAYQHNLLHDILAR